MAGSSLEEDLGYIWRDSVISKDIGYTACFDTSLLNTCSQYKYLLQEEVLSLFQSPHLEHLEYLHYNIGLQLSFIFSCLHLSLKWISLIRPSNENPSLNVCIQVAK